MADVNKADDIADEEVYPNPKENLEDTLAEQDIARELETDLKCEILNFRVNPQFPWNLASFD